MAGYEAKKITEYNDQQNAIMAEVIYKSAIGDLELKEGYNKEEMILAMKEQLDSGATAENVGFMFLLNSFAATIREELPKRKEYVYILHSDHGYKIGRSYEPQTRSRAIGTKTPFEITKTEIFRVKNMSIAEVGLHRHFKQYRLNGEWFNLNEEQLQEARDIIDKQYSEIKETLKPLFERKGVK